MLDQLTLQYLKGQLKVPDKFELGIFRINNHLPVPILVNLYWWAGLTFLYPCEAYASVENDVHHKFPVNSYIVITALDGSLITVLPPTGIQPPAGVVTYDVYGEMVASPNAIGPIPEPTVASPVPTNSASIMVACGTINGLMCVRSQYYALAADSLCVAANEEFTTGFTATFGTTSSSSSSETVATALSMSASAGWGPVSSSISASLNTSSTTSQTYSSFDTQSRYQTDVYKGNGRNTTTILKWQLMDTVTLYTSINKPVATIINGLSPIIKREYDGDALPSPPEIDVSSDFREQVGQLIEVARKFRMTQKD